MKKLKGAFIIVIVLIIVAMGIIGYFYYKGNFNKRNNMQRFQGRNLQLNESQINEVTSFFESTTDINQIESYCQQNRMNCFYYCRNINPNGEYCKQLNQTRPGNYTRKGVQNGGNPLPQ
ncbi:Uncharacterised protein [uncultured archaeon]|nr:Uncharacterised protein [uncultured archaeon]